MKRRNGWKAAIWLALGMVVWPDALAAEETGTLHCGEAVFDRPLDKDDPDFAALSAKMRDIRVLRADFEQEKKLAVLRRPLRSSGTFLFAADKGVSWRTVEPFENLFIITPDAIYQKAEGQKPLVIDVASRPVARGFTDVFIALFSGEVEGLDARFDVFFSAGAGRWAIGLKPKGKILKTLIDRVVLCGGETVESIDFLERSGDRTQIRFIDAATEPAVLSDEERARFELP